MKPVAKIGALALAAALLFSGCSASDKTADSKKAESKTASSETAFPVKVKHSSGETEIKTEPKRIVVLDMGILDTIDAIGAGDKVVGVPTKSVPTWLKDKDGIDYTKVENAGTLKEPDMEAIAKLKPDLVLIGGRTAKLYDQFSKDFATVNIQVNSKGDSYLSDITNSITTIGAAVGKNDEAKEAAKKIDDAIAKYKGKAKDKGTAMALMTSGGEVSVQGLQSRFASIWSVFGFTEPKKTDNDGTHGAKVSFETIKEMNPDYLFVLDRDTAIGKSDPGKAAEKILDNDFVNSTNAVKNKHITYLTPERWYIVMTGANNFLTMLEEINAAL